MNDDLNFPASSEASSPVPPPPPPPPVTAKPSTVSTPTQAVLSEAAHVEDAIVRTTSLTKMYGPLPAVGEVTLAVPRGSIYGLIGPNGAGKTTLMTMVASLLRPSAGSVSVDGHDPAVDSGAVRRITGYMPDGLGVYEGLDVGGYLEFFAAAYEIPRGEWPSLIDGLLELVDLEVKRDAAVNSLSRGMKQRLSLARALVHDPQLLILDEPASGLDPRARIELRELLWALQGMGKTIIVSSHILSELQEICTHVGIMEAGRMLAEGSPDDIGQRLGALRKLKVRFSDGTEEEFEVVDKTAQIELLRRLVNDDERDVLEFREMSAGLEDVFMNVTKGIVQ
ncbi:MAG: ABC transporter ATP-binding protein [Acidimicrobiia bacterium]|nr:ABC transporter ATP-binding protein [Acidimicrobiia bacterium]